MIDLYYYPTPNGFKITIMLEECGLPYALKKVDIQQGEQFRPEFLAINPNNKIPAIVDHDALGGSLAVFESGAILIYLAEKAGRFLPTGQAARMRVLQWLFWQVSGLGPSAGQAHYFRTFAGEKVPYAIDRFTREIARLYGVLNRHLAAWDYLGDDYSIADIATWPFIRDHARVGQSLDDYPHIRRWYDMIAERPAVARGLTMGDAGMGQGTVFW